MALPFAWPLVETRRAPYTLGDYIIKVVWSWV